jgi:hypothetical protein
MNQILNYTSRQEFFNRIGPKAAVSKIRNLFRRRLDLGQLGLVGTSLEDDQADRCRCSLTKPLKPALMHLSLASATKDLPYELSKAVRTDRSCGDGEVDMEITS